MRFWAVTSQLTPNQRVLIQGTGALIKAAPNAWFFGERVKHVVITRDDRQVTALTLAAILDPWREITQQQMMPRWSTLDAHTVDRDQ